MKLYLIFLIICALFNVSESSDNGGCGNRPLVDDILGSRVVGERDAEPGNWPWIVSIQEPGEDAYFHICEGVILNNLWVLTAAHCFNYGDNEYYAWRLVFGNNQRSDTGTKSQIRIIRKKIQHENYNPLTWQNDIALIRLTEAITYDEYTQPACLPSKHAVLWKMPDCYIAGWDFLQNEFTKPSNIFREAEVNLIPVDRCNSPDWYNGAVGAQNLCAGYGGRGIDGCQNDIGGPLMCKRKKARSYAVVGIGSWGSGCNNKQSPGVYTSTQYHREWISEHISKKAVPRRKAVNKTIRPKPAEKIRKAEL